MGDFNCAREAASLTKSVSPSVLFYADALIAEKYFDRAPAESEPPDHGEPVRVVFERAVDSHMPEPKDYVSRRWYGAWIAMQQLLLDIYCS
jgi:hypothetical protein